MPSVTRKADRYSAVSAQKLSPLESFEKVFSVTVVQSGKSVHLGDRLYLSGEY